jgi:hypothetical protein
VNKDKTDIIFWASDTHEGSIFRGHGTLFGGEPVDLGVWAETTETRTGRREHTLPYDSVEAAMKRLEEKFDGFHVTDEPDALDGGAKENFLLSRRSRE